jgi:YegS/Rv2252/BmrU family lipid kinase
MSRKILFFINPISGTRSKLRLEEKITRACLEKNVAFEILFTSRDGDYSFLRDKINKDFISDIAICGGDGSLSPVISAVSGMPVRIGILPLGSGNGLARTAGIPVSVDRALDIILKGKVQATDAFLINNRFSCHVCGLGFDAKVAHDFAKSKSRGLPEYTRLAIKNFIAAKPYPFTVEADGRTFDTEAFLICIANSNQFGNNLKIAPRASLSDGLLDIVILKKTGKAAVVLSFVQQILSGKITHIRSADNHSKDLLYFQTERLSIQNPQRAPLHIDGDPAETSGNFSIEILPGAFLLIQP